MIAGKTLTTLFALMINTSAMAQPAEQSPSEPADVEQIDVIGQRTLLSLRAETQHLEQHMFRLYNELNSSDDFDVACGDKTPTGSKLPVWQCEVAFMRDAEGVEFSRMWDNRTRGTRGVMAFGYVPRSHEQLAFLHREKLKQLNTEMKALALQHPELASALLDLQARREQLAEMERKLKQ
jgi:hypothetical protein